MSKKSRAIKSVCRAANEAGGAGATCAARRRTLRQQMRDAYSHGFQINGIEGLRERHIAGFMARLLQDSETGPAIKHRTACTKMSHIRSALRAAGRCQAADSPSISNAALGIDGAPRGGARTAATAEQYRVARAVAMARDAGLAAMTALQDALGLRLQEALQAGPSLRDWARQIRRGEPAIIIHGTKGGRIRLAFPIATERALAAIAEARAVADQRNGHILPGNLKKASNRARYEWYQYITPASGITSHWMRYAYARERVVQAQQEGLSYNEALARTALELGHGDGRGRWVAQVYLR